MKHTILRCCVFTAILVWITLLAASTGFAQSTFGLSGVVRTPSGAGAPGVKISFKRAAGTGKVPKAVTTDSGGNWSQSGFVPGTSYKVAPKLIDCTFTPKKLVMSAASSTVNHTRACLILPDIFTVAGPIGPWQSLIDARIEIDMHGTRLLRFSNAVGNLGPGTMEIYGGGKNPDGTQKVFQRIFRDDSTSVKRLAGSFEFHATHQHIHFEDFAEYNLRAVTQGGGVGAVVATGGKVSFCLVDSGRLPGFTTPSRYAHCSATVPQGISVGWADVYLSTLPDQWIPITNVPDGTYWLESVTDPLNQLKEGNDANNASAIKITIQGTSVTVVQ